MKRLGLGLVISVAAIAGCSDDGGTPSDVRGTFTIAVTNRDNGCRFMNWTAGDSNANIGVDVQQEDAHVSANVTGLTGTFLTFWLGSSVYSGTVAGDHLDLELFGNKPQTMGNCSYTYNSRIVGDIDNDTLTGRVEYSAATNDNPDCAALEGCLSFQEFNGTRPPT